MTYHAPPEGVSETLELFVVILFHQIDDEGGENQAEKTNVDRRDQFLSMDKSRIGNET